MDGTSQILVVDDKLGPCEALRMMLKPKYRVMTAANGPDALQLLGKTSPDLVLLDIKMRQMDGIEVLKAIKEVDPAIEVIMMTAYASLETARDAMAYGASEYLIKPFSKTEVERAVEKALARRAEHAGARLDVRTLLEQMGTLAHASAHATGQQDLLHSVAVVLEQVKRLLSATAAVVHLVEAPGRPLTCKVCLGLPVQQRGQLNDEAWLTSLRQTLRGRRPLLLTRGKAAPRHDEMARTLEALGYRGGVFFPLLVGDEALGMLSFLYEAPREWREDWISIGGTVADLIALSIHTQQRYQSLQHEAAHQGQRAAQLGILREISRVIMGNLALTDMLQAIGEQLQSGLGYSGFHVWLHGREDTALRRAYGCGPNPGWQPEDADRGPLSDLRVESLTDAYLILAPIVLEGSTVGMLKVVREARQGPPAACEIELIRMLFDSIGLAVKNAQLYEEIKETKGYLENLINSAGDAIITVSRDDLVTSWNPSAECIFQYHAREIVGQKIWTLFPRDLYEQWRQEVVRLGGMKHVETHLQQRHGRPIDVSLTLSPLRGSHEAIVGFSAIVKDVTEDTQLRERLLQAEKLRALGEVAAGIAHNFNNVLATILGRTQLLAYQLGDVGGLQKGLAVIEKAAEDAATMVRRIQEFAKRTTTSAMSPTDLNQLVQEAVEVTQLIWKDQIQRRGRPVEVIMDLGTIPPLRGRAGELREVLTNLILNAVDAMPEGGRLTLRTRQLGEGVRVEVSDTGIGMTDDVKQRLFEPFFTTKATKGTGLGLSTSQALIKEHHGEIEVQSEVRKGTTFTITLPLDPGSTDATAPEGGV